jgi:hypothetical protein
MEIQTSKIPDILSQPAKQNEEVVAMVGFLWC